MLRTQLPLLVVMLLACSGLGSDESPPSLSSTTPSTPPQPPPPAPGVVLPAHDDPALTPPPDPCLDPYPTPAPSGCAMATIACGDTIKGNNESGAFNFDDDFYQSKYCTPQRSSYVDSPEAIYTLTVPTDIKAVVTLTSECEELDIAALSWNEPDRCPTIRHNISECEMDTHDGGGSVTMTTVTRAQDYLIIVEGQKGSTGNFELTVECSQYR